MPRCALVGGCFNTQLLARLPVHKPCDLQAFSAVEQDRRTEAAADCSRMLVPPQMISTSSGSCMQYSVHALSPRLRALAAGCFTEAPKHGKILAVCTIQGRSQQLYDVCHTRLVYLLLFVPMEASKPLAETKMLGCPAQRGLKSDEIASMLHALP